MNEYHFSDLSVGMSESFSYTVTEEKMALFRELSGDENPLHMDAGFAKAHGFPDKVVYGMLTASLISKMGGLYLPGKFCIIQQVEAKFISPVFVDDTLTVTGTVKELDESVQRAVIQIAITDGEQKKKVKAKLYAGFLE